MQTVNNLAETHLDHKEVADLAIAIGNKTTILVTGETGTGKSTTAYTVGEILGYHVARIDCANTQESDIRMPVVLDGPDGRKEYSFIMNTDLGFLRSEPIVLLLDEYTKAPKPVRDAFNPLIERTRSMGQYKLHPDSIVMLSGNESYEGLGDKIEAHTLNRLVRVHMRKPTAEQWIVNWGIPKGCHPVITSWVAETAACLQPAYEVDDPLTNQYIVHPKLPGRPGCTPRSLHTASDILWGADAHNLGNHTVRRALAGTIGEKAADEIMLQRTYNLQKPSWDLILKNPDSVEIPTNPAALLMLLHQSLSAVNKENVAKWFKYFARWGDAPQGMFMGLLQKVPSAYDTLFMHQPFERWVSTKGWKLAAR